MVKKIFALVMVIGVLGAMLGGCAPKEEEPATTATTAGTTTGETKTP